jgi:YHS domain-containing protein
MFRGLFRFLALVVFFAVIRYVIVTVARFFTQVMGSGAAPANAPTEAGPMRGELKKDPVCGTFVSTGTSVKQMVNGELVHFCSTACRDKFRAA